MSAKNILKRLMPTVFAGAAAIVMAMPLSAMAAGGNHRQAVRREVAQHQAEVRHDVAVHRYEVNHDIAVHRYELNHDIAAQRYQRDRWARREYVPNYYPNAAVPVYGPPVYEAPYGGATYGGIPCNMTRLEHVYRRDRATGHPAAANDVARRMQACGAGYAYGPSSVFGNFFNWR